MLLFIGLYILTVICSYIYFIFLTIMECRITYRDVQNSVCNDLTFFSFIPMCNLFVCVLCTIIVIVEYFEHGDIPKKIHELHDSIIRKFLK